VPGGFSPLWILAQASWPGANVTVAEVAALGSRCASRHPEPVGGFNNVGLRSEASVQAA
jgi:hypothetical protein